MLQDSFFLYNAFVAFNLLKLLRLHFFVLWFSSTKKKVKIKLKLCLNRSPPVWLIQCAAEDSSMHRVKETVHTHFSSSVTQQAQNINTINHNMLPSKMVSEWWMKKRADCRKHSHITHYLCNLNTWQQWKGWAMLIIVQVIDLQCQISHRCMSCQGFMSQ